LHNLFDVIITSQKSLEKATKDAAEQRRQNEILQNQVTDKELRLQELERRLHDAEDWRKDRDVLTKEIETLKENVSLASAAPPPQAHPQLLQTPPAAPVDPAVSSTGISQLSPSMSPIAGISSSSNSGANKDADINPQRANVMRTLPPSLQERDIPVPASIQLSKLIQMANSLLPDQRR
jgi:hypothetical protein